MRHMFHRLGICLILVGLVLLGSSAGACQGYVRTEESIAVGKTWMNGTAPAITQLRKQGVKVDIDIIDYFFDFAVVHITQFPGYSGQIEFDVGGWMLIPEFQLLLFFISKPELPKKVNFGKEITISIGKITYSVIDEDDSQFADYLAVRRTENYLEKILVSGYILETAERCDYGSEFTTGDYCFDSTEVITLPRERTTITFKYFSNNERDNTLYEIREVSFFQGSKKFNGRSRSILFVSSFTEFIARKPTPAVCIALIQQLKNDFTNQPEEFDILIPPQRIWFGQKNKLDRYCQ
jgi:hypothetical protein